MARLRLSRAELISVIGAIVMVLGLCLGGMAWLGWHTTSNASLDLRQQQTLAIVEPGPVSDQQSPDLRGSPPISEAGAQPVNPAQPPGAKLPTDITTPLPTDSARSTAFPSPLRSMMITFVTVFVAEMGDKTQLATMLMSAQSRSPWAIFFGSASALVTASLISVLLGEGLAQILPPSTLQLLAGLGFVVIGAYVLVMELWGPQSEEEG